MIGSPVWDTFSSCSEVHLRSNSFHMPRWMALISPVRSGSGQRNRTLVQQSGPLNTKRQQADPPSKRSSGLSLRSKRSSWCATGVARRGFSAPALPDNCLPNPEACG